MAYIWSAELETGNSMIDSQHKELIKALNDFLDACSSGKGRAEIGKTVDFLQSYTAKHFGDEEQLQKRHGYPDHIRHKNLHDGFKLSVRQIADQLAREGPTISLVGKVNSGIGGWLINHIKVEDKKVAAHIRNF